MMTHFWVSTSTRARGASISRKPSSSVPMTAGSPCSSAVVSRLFIFKHTEPRPLGRGSFLFSDAPRPPPPRRLVAALNACRDKLAAFVQGAIFRSADEDVGKPFGLKAFARFCRSSAEDFVAPKLIDEEDVAGYFDAFGRRTTVMAFVGHARCCSS